MFDILTNVPYTLGVITGTFLLEAIKAGAQVLPYLRPTIFPENVDPLFIASYHQISPFLAESLIHSCEKLQNITGLYINGSGDYSS